MRLDPLLLSRVQFFWVIAWHILLPAFTVGIASYIALLEGLHVATGREKYLNISKFWIRIFAVAFGMGVVSGVVMPFQLGTNWSRFTDATADVLSPLFAYEALTAFFLESGFLGILLFGRSLVSARMQFFAALMVAFGTLLSSFWILAANSWMQTPAGYAFAGGRFEPLSWAAIIFNPSFPYRFVHTVIAFYVTTGFVVAGVAARYLRQARFAGEARTMLSTTLWLLTVLVPLQIFAGDQHGLNTLQYQPAKLAGIEANWQTRSHAPLILFAIPNESNQINRYEIAIPELGSLVLKHDVNGDVPGLKDFPREDRPSVAIPFFAFRVMVAIGVLMLLLILAGLWLRWRRKLYASRGFLIACEIMSPAGFVAVLAGWITAEAGRQPWTVYGVLRTAESVSPSLTGGDVALSLLGYMVAYAIMFPAGLLLMWRLVKQGLAKAEETAEIEAGKPRHPIAAGAGPR